MSARMHRYLFGRFNVMATYNDKEAFIFEGFSTTKILDLPPHEWAFSGVARVEPTGDLLPGTFLAGTLVKFRPEGQSKIINTENHEVHEAAIPNQVIAEAPFFLHVPTGMIAYRPISGEIEAGTFRRRVAELFQEEYDNLLVQAEIHPIENELVFMEELRALDEVSRIIFELHPSNPSNRDLWQETDDRLRDLDVSRYKEEYQMKPGTPSGKVAKDKNIAAKAQMAEDGYGKARAVGKKGKKDVVISTADNPVDAKVPATTADRLDILKALGGAFSGIANRFKKKDATKS